VICILILAEIGKSITELSSALTHKNYSCSMLSYEDALIENILEKPPDLVLLEIIEQRTNPVLHELIQNIKQDKLLPVITLISMETIAPNSWYLDVDDFLVRPFTVDELDVRIRRILTKINVLDFGALIKYDDLIIDPAKYEVTIKGTAVKLTFKEYELLKFLALGKGHVYTRETLLNKIWGYGYYGGDRTVDVHVRRLRSKIEDISHTYIETVRNVGYRFLTD
jgi:DNA-binding response OmpR family regulator